MKKKAYSFELKNCLSELDTLCRNLEKYGRQIGLSKKMIFELNLALDELFTNIISYGFKDGEDHCVRVTLTPEKDVLCLCIEDDGIEFDPTEFEQPDASCSVSQCKIGGLGIHIIKKLMDEICYERCEGKNILRLKKRLGEKGHGKKASDQAT